MEAIDRCQRKRDAGTGRPSSPPSRTTCRGYLYKTTKRNPMILPVIMEI